MGFYKRAVHTRQVYIWSITDPKVMVQPNTHLRNLRNSKDIPDTCFWPSGLISLLFNYKKMVWRLKYNGYFSYQDKKTAILMLTKEYCSFLMTNCWFLPKSADCCFFSSVLVSIVNTIKRNWFSYFLCIRWTKRSHFSAITFWQSLKEYHRKVTPIGTLHSE